jgi:hypothetical protein
MEGRRRDPLPTAQVEAIAGWQRMEDDAADHQRPVAMDLPGVRFGCRTVDDRDRAPADHLHHVIRADNAGGVLVDAQAEQARVLGDEAEQPPEPVPLLEMLVDDHAGEEAEAGGADARAYWAGVRIWLNGGDPYHPTGPFLPYVYAPWMLPLFTPWAALPWDVAWFAWRVGTILLLLWTIDWAYRRRPLTTAVTVALLGFPFGANLDTGNINLQLTLMLWAAQFTGPRVGGLLWALATWMKWIPLVHWLILGPRTRLWGLGWLAVSIGLSLVTLPLTIIQMQTLFGFGARPIRLDYLVYVWALVPWLYRARDPFTVLRPASWRSWMAAARVRVAR